MAKENTISINSSTSIHISEKGFFSAAELRAIRPLMVPELPKGSFYLGREQTPYLRKFILAARAHGYSHEDMMKAWATMLNNKSNLRGGVEGERLNLGEAVTFLFDRLGYYGAKLHYCAYTEYSARPEKYAD